MAGCALPRTRPRTPAPTRLRPRVAHTSRGRNTHHHEGAAMNTSDVLNKAADLIEERGWASGAISMLGRDGRGNESGVCIMGAIFAAQTGRLARANEGDASTYDVVGTCDAGLALNTYLQLDKPANELWRWNDHGARYDGLNQERVIEVLRACAVIEASRERQSAEVSA